MGTDLNTANAVMNSASELENELEFDEARRQFENAANLFVINADEASAKKAIKSSLEIREYQHAVGHNPYTLCDYASKKINNGQFNLAGVVCEQTLELIPEMAEAHHLTSIVAGFSGDLDLSASAAYRALQLAPENTKYVRQLSRVYLTQENQEKAAEIMGQEITLMRKQGELPSIQQREAIDAGVPPICFFAQNKSASEYARDVLLRYTGAHLLYPTLGTFPRDIPIATGFEILSLGGALARLHSDASPLLLKTLENFDIQNFVVLFRDPRQSILSWVRGLSSLPGELFRHHCVYFAPHLPRDFQMMREAQQFQYATQYLYGGLIEWIDGWLQVEKKLQCKGAVTFLCFEDFQQDPKSYFNKISSTYGVPLPKLEVIEREICSQDHSNFRLGQTQEWREVFSKKMQTQLTELMPKKFFERFDW